MRNIQKEKTYLARKNMKRYSKSLVTGKLHKSYETVHSIAAGEWQ